jgi:hypothetical protein
MARLRLLRPYDEGGILRRLRVEVDGQEVAALRQYRSVDLELSPGRHRVVGRMDGVSSASLDIDLAADEQLQLEVALPLVPMWDRLQRTPRTLSIRRL